MLSLKNYRDEHLGRGVGCWSMEDKESERGKEGERERGMGEGEGEEGEGVTMKF